MAAEVSGKSSTGVEPFFCQRPTDSAALDRLFPDVAHNLTGSSGQEVLQLWPLQTQGGGTQMALTIVNDSASMLRNVQVTHAVAPWVDYVSDRLSALEDPVEPGLPATEVINRARTSIMHLLPPAAPSPAVLPSEEGGIDFVWHRAGWNVEIAVERDGNETVWLWNRASNEEVFGDLEEHREVLLDLIRAFSRRD